MHPATSVILFTVLSGAGFGMLAFLGLGAARPEGLDAFLVYALAYALSGGGLLASTFHLGNPQRFLKAFSQWRTSWLSREAWAAVATLILFAPVALAAVFAGFHMAGVGVLSAVLALVTVVFTSMIYAQLRTVPRWRHWTTPALFLAFALTGGAILTGGGLVAAILAFELAVLLGASFAMGDRRFQAGGSTIGTATGLAAIGAVRAFEPPHTGSNYLMREMIHLVGRKHRARLRIIAIVGAGVLPGLILLTAPAGLVPTVLAALIHLIGAFAARWLFFAEAEHVVGLYYGKR